jgi:hypothetical protein
LFHYSIIDHFNATCNARANNLLLEYLHTADTSVVLRQLVSTAHMEER